MPRLFAACALIVIVSVTTAEDKPSTQTISLSLTSALPPKPALKYRLLPFVREMMPGNRIQGYYKCFMEQHHFFFDKEMSAARENYQKCSLKELPIKELANYGGLALRLADEAARLNHVDWQILPQLRRDGAYLLLPDLQYIRMLAGALKVRLRVEIADKRYGDAARTASTMLALAQDLGEHPTFIGNLVGIAIATMAVNGLEEWISQPESPNLYWALRNLPEHPVRLRRGMQGERLWLEKDLGSLEGLPLSEAQLQTIITSLNKTLESDKIGKIQSWIDAQLKKQNAIDSARKRVAANYPENKHINRMSSIQILLIDEKAKYEAMMDDIEKGFFLPYWEAEKQLGEGSQMKAGLFSRVLPSIVKIRKAQVRLEQRIAILQTIEAIRYHSAINTGKLPAELSACKYPIPMDPVSGKPFTYTQSGTKATLRGFSPKGEEKNPVYNLIYQIQLK